MEKYFEIILKFRWFVIAFIILLTIISFGIITRGVFASSIGSMFLGENPEYQNYISKSSIFGSNDVLIISFKEPELLSKEGQKRVTAINKNISKIKYISNVRSALDIPRISGEGDTITVLSYSEAALENPERAKIIYEELRSDPLAKEIFISKDGVYSNLIIEIDPASDMPAELVPDLIDGIIQHFKNEGYSREDLRLVGLPVSICAIINQTRFNIVTLFPIVCFVLLVVAWLLFRRLWPVALTMAIAFIAMSWTIGFSVLIDKHISILASMIPAVILIISFSDVVHLCSAYLLELGLGKGKKEAIFSSGKDVGKACLLTSATTFLGFLALSFVPAPIFRQLGASLGFGVAVALLLAITLAPIFFSLIPKPKPLRVGATGKVQSFLDGFLSGAALFVSKRPWEIIIIFIVIFIVAIVGIFNVTIETDFDKRLDKDHPVRLDGEFFNRNFAGSNSIDIYVSTKEKGGILNPDVFSKIAQFQDSLESVPEVKMTYSLVDLMEVLHRELNRDKEGPARLPDSPNALAQYLLTLESSGSEELERLISFNRDTIRIGAQLQGEAVVFTYNTGMKAQNLGNEIMGEMAIVKVTGLIFLMGQWIDDIVAGQRRGLLFALISIAIMMVVGLKSLRVGLWSMIPNIMPLFVLGGYLGLFWGHVDSDVLGIAMVAIGIGVDDTIHFLTRLKIEWSRTENVDEAIQKTFHFSGRGIVMTTIILVAGFSPFILSDYLSIEIMGTLLPMTLVAALLADLFFAPALVKVGAIRFSKKS